MSCRRKKKRKTVYLQYSKFKKGYNSYKNGQKVTTLLLDLKFIKRKSYTKFQLNISKRVGQKAENFYLHYSKFQKGYNSYKTGRKLALFKLDLKFNKTKSHTFHLIISKHVGEMCRKLAETRTDEDSDGRRPGRRDITIPLYVPSEDGRIKTRKYDAVRRQISTIVDRRTWILVIIHVSETYGTQAVTTKMLQFPMECTWHGK